MMQLGAMTIAFFAITCISVEAQTVTGTWQSSAPAPRLLQIEKTDKGLTGQLYNIGEQAGMLNGNPASKITLKNRSVHFDLDRKLGTFDGMLAPDGNSIIGTWQTNGTPQQLSFVRTHEDATRLIDPSPHKIRFVTVAKGVKLEVLDWGGKGPPLVFLTGWGNTAHVYDTFASSFTDKHHVYGITRRGFGLSSTPPPTSANFDPDRLGDDVLAVMDQLKLVKPVLAGHSVAGQELSSIGTRHPDKVAGLIYLDASQSDAFYDPKGGFTVQLEAENIRQELQTLPKGAAESAAQLRQVIRDLPLLEKALERDLATVDGLPERPADLRMTYQEQVSDIMAQTRRKYVGIQAPFLAIIAVPYKCNPSCDVPTEKAWAGEVLAQADAVQADYPQDRIVRLPNANHYVFRSNQAEVAREMNSFMDGLPK